MKFKVFLIIIETILFIGFIYLSVVNYLQKTIAGFNITASSDGFIELNTFTIILIFYLFGCFSGYLYSLIKGQGYKDLISFYARRNEKLSQQNEIESDEKEVLQRKIASLEIALNNALQNNSK